ncbi:hypothetical protein [Acinetobacter modestus]|uniref:hypothetical protein n=1 Tax=Acinetobacter modestus TaxID=1776740 RepID=UPI0032080446
MHTLLTVQEAFAARQAGKSIVCRHVESELFEKLNNVSADTWFDPHYVFAIEIETITLGGLEFTRPYTLTELTTGDEIYFCGASGKILKGKFNPENEMLIAGVKNGSVQRDEVNAIAQVTAFRSLLNIEVEAPIIIDYDFFVVDDEPKKSRGRKKKDVETKLVETEPQDSEHEPLDESDTNVKKMIDAINSVANLVELDSIEAELSNNPWKYVQDELNQFQDLINQKRQQLEKQVADTAITSITERLEKATTIAELNDLELEVKNQRLVTPQVQDDCDQLLIDIAAKREQLNKLSLIEPGKEVTEQNLEQLQEQDDFLNSEKSVISSNLKSDYMLNLTKASLLSSIASLENDINKDSRLISTHKHHLLHYVQIRKTALEKDAKYESELESLTNQVSSAATTAQANDVILHTQHWTEKQRIPLLAAISKRLVELDVSLLNQIRNAPSMAILNSLLSEVENLAPGTYPHQCMEAYAARKNQLTEATA